MSKLTAVPDPPPPPPHAQPDEMRPLSHELAVVLRRAGGRAAGVVVLDKADERYLEDVIYDVLVELEERGEIGNQRCYECPHDMA